MAHESGCGCGCEQEIILVSGGIPGPPGPTGPQGPAGPGGTFPIAANNISVTNAGFSNAQEVFDYLLYIPLVITSFASAVSKYLIGSTVSNLTFSWSINKTVLTKVIVGPNLSPIAITTSPTAAALSPSLTPSSVGSTYTYTLSADDGVNVVNANTVIGFYNNIYYGDSTVPGSIDSAFVTGLTNSIQAGKAFTVISNATGLTTYAWFACRQALGGVSFVVAGFPGGFMLVSGGGLSVTNSAGFTETYNVYRSVNPAIGPVTYTTS